MGGEDRGYDGGKKVKGRKRHILVDTEGFVLKAKIHSAKVLDHEGSRRCYGEPTGNFPASLTYSEARVLLAGDAEAKELEHRRVVRTRGLKRSSTSRNYAHSEPRFHTLLTEGGGRVLFHREGFDRPAKTLA